MSRLTCRLSPVAYVLNSDTSSPAIPFSRAWSGTRSLCSGGSLGWHDAPYRVSRRGKPRSESDWRLDQPLGTLLRRSHLIERPTFHGLGWLAHRREPGPTSYAVCGDAVWRAPACRRRGPSHRGRPTDEAARGAGLRPRHDKAERRPHRCRGRGTTHLGRHLRSWSLGGLHLRLRSPLVATSVRFMGRLRNDARQPGPLGCWALTQIRSCPLEVGGRPPRTGAHLHRIDGSARESADHDRSLTVDV